ncbi:MAG: Phytoene synthase, partial [uncultured Corynebacteriales bacterium]
ERPGAGRRRDHRPGAARLVRAVPAAQRRARPDLLPGHAAAAGRQAPVRARALRLRPVRRRDRRRPRLHADRRGEGRLAAGLGRGLPGRRADRRVRAPGEPGGGGHRAAVGHRGLAVRGLPGLHADGPHRHRLPDVRRPDDLRLGLGGGDRAADGAGAGAGGAARGRRAVRGRPRGGLPAVELPPGRRRGPAPRPGLPAGRGPGPVRGDPGAPGARGGGRAGPPAAGVRGGADPGALPQRRAGRPAAAPDVAGLHPDRAAALRRHPGRGGAGRLPGAGPAGVGRRRAPGPGGGPRAGPGVRGPARAGGPPV